VGEALAVIQEKAPHRCHLDEDKLRVGRKVGHKGELLPVQRRPAARSTSIEVDAELLL